MKAKKLKTGRSVLMPTFTRRLKSFKLDCVNLTSMDQLHHQVHRYVDQLNRLSHLIDGAALEKKAPVVRG